MNVCIIGGGLTSLTLAKNLINKKINVHIYHHDKTKNLTSNRTIGISKDNLEFFNREIYKIPKKNCWGIKKIEIYSQKLKNETLINFENKKNDLFYMIRNDELYGQLDKKICNNKFFKRKIIKNNFNEELLKKKNYDLIINCDSNNFLAKKYFLKKIEKNYCNFAYTTIIKHRKIENNTAVQNFTEYGPIAFLPISNFKTSVVCSLDVKNRKFNNIEVMNLINRNNPKYKITNISKITCFKLSSSNLRNYYQKNILAFGDLLHRIHPLAGQGFNMTIRDIKILSEIIENRIDIGMNLNSTIFEDFENKTKHKNFIFSNGVDFIYEFFNFEKRIKNTGLSKTLKFIGKNKTLNKVFIKLANSGFNN